MAGKRAIVGVVLFVLCGCNEIAGTNDIDDFKQDEGNVNSRWSDYYRFSDYSEGINLSGNSGQTIAFNANWFVNDTDGDVHLSVAGQSGAGTSAQWASGDPLYHIDGDLRPQSSTDYPGIDQP